VADVVVEHGDVLGLAPGLDDTLEDLPEAGARLRFDSLVDRRLGGLALRVLLLPAHVPALGAGEEDEVAGDHVLPPRPLSAAVVRVLDDQVGLAHARGGSLFGVAPIVARRWRRSSTARRTGTRGSSGMRTRSARSTRAAGGRATATCSSSPPTSGSPSAP